jgi:hypothetical protein
MKQQEDTSRRRFLKMTSALGLTVAFSSGTIGKGIWRTEIQECSKGEQV